MKTKEYIRQFHLYKAGSKINSTKLAQELEKEFLELLEKNNGKKNLNEFKACTDKVIFKIDTINLKALTEIHEGFVRFFYATVILKYKKQFFPKVVAQEEKRYSSIIHSKP